MSEIKVYQSSGPDSGDDEGEDMPSDSIFRRQTLTRDVLIARWRAVADIAISMNEATASQVAEAIGMNSKRTGAYLEGAWRHGFVARRRTPLYAWVYFAPLPNASPQPPAP
jgi:hypothetical protein